MPNPVKDGATGGRLPTYGGGGVLEEDMPETLHGPAPRVVAPLPVAEFECWTCLTDGKPLPLFISSMGIDLVALHRGGNHDVRPVAESRKS